MKESSLSRLDLSGEGTQHNFTFVVLYLIHLVMLCYVNTILRVLF